MKKNTVGIIGHGRNGKRGIAEGSRLTNTMREQVRREEKRVRPHFLHGNETHQPRLSAMALVG